MFDFLKAVGLHPMDWTDALRSAKRPSVHISDIVTSAMAEAQAILVLFTGDDRGQLRKRFRRKSDTIFESKPMPQPRLNVVFEAGMAFGRSPQRTILVQLGHKMRPFSDISGVHIIQFTGKREHREELREQLRLAGCAISRRTRRWLTAGDFDRPVHGR
jgi:predicted nucleotide-binding protein